MSKIAAKLCPLIWLLIIAIFPNKALAISKFSTTYQVQYTVNSNSTTHVKYSVFQKNNLSVVYATDFSLSVNHTRIENVRVMDESAFVIPEVVKTKNQSTISFPFVNKVVGIDKVHTFVIDYDTLDVATKFGNTWQINIPKIDADENLVEQTVILTIPSSFPLPAYINPKPDTSINNSFFFSGKTMSNKPISAVFGVVQYYKVKLSYHLQNDTSEKNTYKIAIPPDTNYQTVFIDKINPKPEKIVEDQDGNWLASYTIGPNKGLDIDLEEGVKLNLIPSTSILDNQEKYLKSNNLWDYESSIFTIPEVQNLNSGKEIYDFVTDKLTYDYKKVTQSNQKKSTASSALKNPDSAICTDFTNLFVALARRSGIPAREIQGYAVSENQDLNPISVNQDVLHSWPEFFDKDKSTWIQIDPTWSNTTRGVDYFNKLDLNHITFVIHGIDPLSPLSPGGYKIKNENRKDVFVTPVENLEFPEPGIVVEGGDSEDVVLKNNTGVSFHNDISVEENTYLKSQIITAKVIPYSESVVKLEVKNHPLILPAKTEAIIYLNGGRQTITLTISPRVPSFAILAAGLGLLGSIAFLARGLHLRKHKR